MAESLTINILTIFPEFFDSFLNTSMVKIAQEKQLVNFKVVNLRDYAQDKHQTTDDRPFGGGPGMVMMVEPIDLALKALNIKKNASDRPPATKQAATHKIVLTSAKGKTFTQATARNYAQLSELTIICGHYEGVDERVAQQLIDEEVRIGDYVLTGGEPASLVIADSVLRLIPGVLGNEASNKNESHTLPGHLAHPVYTRPKNYCGWEIPEILLSGNHQNIDQWRQKQKKATAMMSDSAANS